MEEEKIIYKREEHILTISLNGKQPTRLETDRKEIGSKQLKLAVNKYLKNYDNYDIEKDETLLLIHKILLENNLWTTSDLKKEVLIIDNKLDKSNDSVYLENITDEIIEHYLPIYTRKGI